MPYRTGQDPLGAVESVHRSPFPLPPIALAWLVFGLPGIGLVTGFQSAPGEVFSGDRVTNSVLGIALLGIAVAATVLFLRKATLRVELHANGLRWHERGRSRDIRWEDVAEVKAVETRRSAQGIHVTTTKVYRIVLADGTVYVATNMLAGIDALGKRLLEQTS